MIWGLGGLVFKIFVGRHVTTQAKPSHTSITQNAGRQKAEVLVLQVDRPVLFD